MSNRLVFQGIDHIDEIIELVFQYLKLVKEKGIEEWVFEEFKNIHNMQFRFKDKERPQNYVSSTASRLHEFPLKEVLTGPWWMDKWQPDLIRDLLGYLVPEKIYAVAVGQKFKDKATSTEIWYGTKYITETIDDAKIKAWENTESHPRLHMFEPNEFIPTDFEMVTRDEMHKHGRFVPTIVRESPFSRLWLRQDDEFLLPKAIMTFEIRSPIVYMEPHFSNLGTLFVMNFNDDMTEYSYAGTQTHGTVM